MTWRALFLFFPEVSTQPGRCNYSIIVDTPCQDHIMPTPLDPAVATRLFTLSMLKRHATGTWRLGTRLLCDSPHPMRRGIGGDVECSHFHIFTEVSTRPERLLFWGNRVRRIGDGHVYFLPSQYIRGAFIKKIWHVYSCRANERRVY